MPNSIEEHCDDCKKPIRVGEGRYRKVCGKKSRCVECGNKYSEQPVLINELEFKQSA